MNRSIDYDIVCNYKKKLERPYMSTKRNVKNLIESYNRYHDRAKMSKLDRSIISMPLKLYKHKVIMLIE